MKVQLEVTGGFAYLPALSKPVSIDTDQVDPGYAAQLESLIRSTNFFEQPARSQPASRGAADYQTYNITVSDNNGSHTIQVTDPVTDPNLQKLISLIRNIGGPSKT